MMNQAQLTVLRAELQRPEYDGISYEGIVWMLTDRETEIAPNPVTEAPLVPVPLRMAHVLGVVMAADAQGLKNMLEALGITVADLIGQQVKQMDMESIQAYMAVAAMYLNTTAIDAVQALLTDPPTQADPTWTETITVTLPSRADELGLPAVRTEDVQAALNLVEVA